MELASEDQIIDKRRFGQTLLIRHIQCVRWTTDTEIRPSGRLVPRCHGLLVHARSSAEEHGY